MDKYKKVSNNYYAHKQKDYGKEYEKVDGHFVKNNYELDLFFYVNNNKQYYICEGRTGASISGTGEETIYDATNRMIYNMRDERKNRIENQMKKYIEKYGLTPRYCKVGNYSKPLIPKELFMID